MSIWLFSGINGSGKTLSAIRTVLTDPKFAIQDDKGKEVAKRPVYYYGIQDCALPWTELDADGEKTGAIFPLGPSFSSMNAGGVFLLVLRRSNLRPLCLSSPSIAS